ncbi:Piso0_002600 [Millerozyma farinosa CBS 7064]|uniref:Piso0_002600 protein n=1 Tax=Pichia sorbitophila (strain ATCC MYA-4447 / BCRC 22081 / CBS 7064 / NBRC 10061 / NRRL Y-12695) TaxID=559304 RepID=G8YD18_PICSO|nr:Piso0_002600 [Millerozyma farinosa CBS 7064]
MSGDFVDQVSYMSFSNSSENSCSTTLGVLLNYFNALNETRDNVILNLSDEERDVHTIPEPPSARAPVEKYQDEKYSPNQNEQVSQEEPVFGIQSGQTEGVKSFQGSIADQFIPKERQRGSLVLTRSPEPLVNPNVESIRGERRKRIKRKLSGALEFIQSSFRKENKNTVTTPYLREGEKEIEETAKYTNTLDESKEAKKKQIRFFGSSTRDDKRPLRDWHDTQRKHGEGSIIAAKLGRAFKNKEHCPNNSFSALRLFKNDLNDESKIPSSKTAFVRVATSDDVHKERNKTNGTPQVSEDISVGHILDLYNLSGGSSASETAHLENTIFSPHTHRPSLRDISSIETLQQDDAQNVQRNGESLFKDTDSTISDFGENEAQADDCLGKRNEHEQSVGLKSIKLRSPIQIQKSPSDWTSDKYLEALAQSAKSEAENETFLTPRASLSESFSTLKGIVKQKCKSSMSRKSERRHPSLHVRFVSPIFSPSSKKFENKLSQDRRKSMTPVEAKQHPNNYLFSQPLHWDESCKDDDFDLEEFLEDNNKSSYFKSKVRNTEPIEYF